MHLLRLIGICTQIIGGRYDQTRTDTAINNLWYSDDRYLDEAADALEAQAKEIAELTQMVADLEGIRQIDVDEFNQLKTLCDLMGAALEEMLESCECDINAGRIAAREALEGQP